MTRTLRHVCPLLVQALIFSWGLAACSDDSTPTVDSGSLDSAVMGDGSATDSAAGGDSTATADLPSGPSCNETADCESDQYCELGESCGGGAPGVCLARPTSCPEAIELACGCDGLTYDNSCLAQAAGTSVAYIGECGKKQCQTDDDCLFMGYWCEGGVCVECSNDGLSCGMACQGGGGQTWELYERNGCTPCACAPTNECSSDADCDAGETCYAGSFCWDWCPAGDPSCCYGNRCSLSGCSTPNPEGCWTRGCPAGQQCVDSGCASSDCGCSGSEWYCDSDCGGGTCVAQ